jgi:hypothetical protein
MPGRFLVEETFSLAARGLFVAHGQLVEGTVVARECVTAAGGVRATIGAVEFVLLSAVQGRENLALCFRFRDEAELARWRQAILPGEMLDIRPSAQWQLWRQDDNGNRVMIRAFANRDEAEAELRHFESLQHKQTYWLDERPVSGSEAPAG